jgi:mRNA-degrading endonuclease RelE of RelBE toxin-antitoxin system
MKWAVELSASAVKELRRLPRDRLAQIARSIDEMGADPMAGDVKPLKGDEWKGYFRKRVGSYRIIFELDRASQVVAVSAILIRSERTYR